jgi:hypothetical protein
MKINNMKKLILLLIFALTLSACEQSLSQQEKKVARQREKDKKEQVVETPVVAETPAPVVAEPEPIPYYEPATTYTQLTTIPTYWYIRFDETTYDNDGKYDGTSDWHWAVKLNTPYFDFMEAMNQLAPEVNKKRIFFNYMTQISKESYDSFFTFRRVYHGK